MGMAMTWNWDQSPVIVFKWLQPGSTLEFIALVFLVGCFGVLVEFMAHYHHEFSQLIVKAITVENKRRKSWEQSLISSPSSQVGGTGETNSLQASFYGTVPQSTLSLERPTPLKVSKQSYNTSHVRSKRTRLLLAARAILYAAYVLLNTLNMLILMTFNGYLIIASVAGRSFGHYLFNPPSFAGPSPADCC